MKKQITVLVAIPAIIFVVVYAIMNFDFLNEKQKKLVDLHDRQFILETWHSFPDITNYRLYFANKSKTKGEFITQGSTDEGIPEFERLCITNGMMYVRLGESRIDGGKYLAISGDHTEVFDWKPKDKYQPMFAGYFHWILATGSFWECDDIAKGMYHWWGDEKALAFLKRIVEEDPASDFFPKDTTGDFWWENYKDSIAQKIENNPNQKLQPTVTTPVESGNVQGTAAEL